VPDLPHLLFRAALAAARLGRPRCLSVLIYHRVLAERDWMRPGEPTAEEFTWQMRLLGRHFNVLPLADAVQMMKDGRLPPRAACVTFDDGYADNATVALPILKRYGIPATVFVSAGYLDGGRMWNDTIVEALRTHPDKHLDLGDIGLPGYTLGDNTARRHAAYDIIRRSKYQEMARRDEVAARVAQASGLLPADLMMTTAQLRTLHQQGIEIGGHTVSHPILARLPVARAREEIAQGKAALEALIGAPLRLFAYPNGQPDMDYTDDHVALVKEAGFVAAVSTNWGVSDRRSDPFQLPRFTPWDKSAAKFLLRMALNSRHLQRTPEREPC